jgi:hypothetical protein
VAVTQTNYEAIKMKAALKQIGMIILLLTLVNIQNVGMAAQSAESLSGEYQLYFEQTSKTCGNKINPVDLRVTINFSDVDVTLRFPSGFLGIDILTAKYDAQTATFDDQLQQSVNLGPVKAILALDIKGKLVKQSANPVIEFDISFSKTADDPDWNCKVTGQGRAKKL